MIPESVRSRTQSHVVQNERPRYLMVDVSPRAAAARDTASALSETCPTNAGLGGDCGAQAHASEPAPSPTTRRRTTRNETRSWHTPWCYPLAVLPENWSTRN